MSLLLLLLSCTPHTPPASPPAAGEPATGAPAAATAQAAVPASPVPARPAPPPQLSEDPEEAAEGFLYGAHSLAWPLWTYQSPPDGAKATLPGPP
jgi:hypothetical protein